MGTAFNNSGVATIATGFILPEIMLPDDKVPIGLFHPYVAFIIGIALLVMAQVILGALKDD